MKCKHFLCFVLFLTVLKQALSADDLTYRAAVLEYYPVQNNSLTPDERTNANVDRYVEIINELEDKTFDILVLPEYTITTGQTETRPNLVALATVVPEISENVVPCTGAEFPEFFTKLSCLSKSLSTYMVVNLLEKAECSSKNCASDKWNVFNTNVVFDRNGTVIQRYRKYNLFGENGVNVTDKADVVTFETDFGVRFGQFTCFDILFEEPALELVRGGVKHIIFTTMWFSELPFLSALQAQNMFAIENDVVFLASGANSAQRGSGGSGIYQGKRGPIVYDIIADDGSKVYVADVLKEWDSESTLEESISTDDNVTDELALTMDNFYIKKENLSIYKTYPLVQDDLDAVFEDNSFSCRLSYKLTNENITDTHYEYALFYYSGIRTFSGVRDAGINVCSVVFCQDYSLEDGGSDTCGERFESYENVQWNYVFEELSISANFTVSDSSVQYPNTLLSSIRPMDRSDYAWTTQYFDDDKIVEKTLTILKPQHRLMTFGIFARDFSKDSSASWLSSNNFVIFIGLALIGRLVF